MIPKLDVPQNLDSDPHFIESTQNNGSSIDNNNTTNGFNTIKINRPNKTYQTPIINSTDDFNLFQTHNNGHTPLDQNNSTSDSNIEMTSSVDSLSNEFMNKMNGFDSNDKDNGYQHKSVTNSFVDANDSQQVLDDHNHAEAAFDSLNACLTETTNKIASTLSLAINTNNNNNNLIHNTNSSTSKVDEMLNHNNHRDQNGGGIKPSVFSKDLNKEERLRIIRDKQEQELARRKRELEENLKRKEDTWSRQLKEKQKRIDENKVKENDKRLACEDRRRKREEVEKNRLIELVRRDSERAKLSSGQGGARKGSEWTLAVNGNGNEVAGSADEQSVQTSGMNKSHSAYNLNLKKRESANSDNVINKVDSSPLSKRLANSSMRLNHGTSKHQAAAEAAAAEEASQQQNSQKAPLHTIVERNKPLSAHLQETINRLSMPKKAAIAPEDNPTTNNNNNNNINTNPISTNHHNAHYLNPINNHRSITPQLENANDNLSSNTATSSSNSLTLNKKAKPVGNKKSVVKPKIPNSKSSNGLGHTTSQTAQHEPPQVKQKNLKIDAIKQSARYRPMGQSSSNGSISSLNHNNLIPNQFKKSNSTLALNQQKPPITKSSNFKNKIDHASSHMKINSLASNSTASCDSITKKDNDLVTKSEISQVISDMIEISAVDPTPTIQKEVKDNEIATDFKESEANKLEEVATSSGDSLVAMNLVVPVAVARVLTEEETYKIKMDEIRREARERAAIEAELERERQEVLRRQEERKQREEMELERLAEEELNRIHKVAREMEEERLRVAMELNEKMESERRVKEEAERKVKEENERRAKEESERLEKERLEKIRMEDEERLERRKKIDLIMRRVHNKEETNFNSLPSTQTTTNSTTNLLISASNTDLTSVKSMTSSLIQARDPNNDNSSTTLCASMTTSMINPPMTTLTNNNTDTITTTNESSRFKTPLLQSILSKTRITTILNKYADDSTNPTLNLIAQQQSRISIDGNDESSESRVLVDLGIESDDGSSQENKSEGKDIKKLSYDGHLEMSEVSVVVDENSSADSSSPSSPVSLASTTSSGQASPPNTPAQISTTQISA